LGGKNGITGEFKYSTLGIHILNGIISKRSGMQTVEFANKYLFDPLDIAPYSNYEAKSAEEHKEFILSKTPKGNIWFVDPLGVATAGYGLCMSAQDMAKIGQLCLDNGIYKGERIVSQSWLKESTKPRIQCDKTFAYMRYGYLWWTPDKDRSAFAALGNSGNVIYVNPEHNSVVTVIGTFKPTIFDRVQFIQNYIEPLFNE
jgi:CubicO group peptidase (beta-lactamase class C family)